MSLLLKVKEYLRKQKEKNSLSELKYVDYRIEKEVMAISQLQKDAQYQEEYQLEQNKPEIIQMYEKEIKENGLSQFMEARDEHFRSQVKSFFYTVGVIWPIFGFSNIANKKPEGLMEVITTFAWGVVPSLAIGSIIFGIIVTLLGEFVYRMFKDYRESYDNVRHQKINFINTLKDLKNQKIIIDFMNWKRKYHLAPLVFTDSRNNTTIDVEKQMISAFINRNYEYVVDLFIRYQDRIESANTMYQTKRNQLIENYRNSLDKISLNPKEEESEMELEMEVGDAIKRRPIKYLL